MKIAVISSQPHLKDDRALPCSIFARRCQLPYHVNPGDHSRHVHLSGVTVRNLLVRPAAPVHQPPDHAGADDHSRGDQPAPDRQLLLQLHPLLRAQQEL